MHAVYNYFKNPNCQIEGSRAFSGVWCVPVRKYSYYVVGHDGVRP